MKIIRIINGEKIEIELTNEEISQAYEEAEFVYDCLNIENSDILQEFLQEKNIELEDIQEEIKIMAKESRKLIDRKDYYWLNAVDEVIDNFINQNS